MYHEIFWKIAFLPAMTAAIISLRCVFCASVWVPGQTVRAHVLYTWDAPLSVAHLSCGCDLIPRKGILQICVDTTACFLGHCDRIRGREHTLVCCHFVPLGWLLQIWTGHRTFGFHLHVPGNHWRVRGKKQGSVEAQRKRGAVRPLRVCVCVCERERENVCVCVCGQNNGIPTVTTDGRLYHLPCLSASGSTGSTPNM